MPKADCLIYGCKQARPTARMLSDLLGWDYEEGTLTVNPNHYKVIFRYGNTVEFNPDSGFGNYSINCLKGIKQTSDKLQCRMRLIEHEISVPMAYDIGTFRAIKKYPVIARPFQHFQGRNFKMANDPKEAEEFIKNGYYLQDVVDKALEFRLFMWRNRIMEASLKTKRRENANEMVRNHRHGWGFKKIRVSELDSALKKNCINASALFSLMWCAIDCCIDTKGRTYIFEVNSAPGLVERKAQKLADKVAGFLVEKGVEWKGKVPPPVQPDELDEENAQQPEPDIRDSPFYNPFDPRRMRPQPQPQMWSMPEPPPPPPLDPSELQREMSAIMRRVRRRTLTPEDNDDLV